MGLRFRRVAVLLAAVGVAGASSVIANPPAAEKSGGYDPSYVGPAPKTGANTDGSSYRKDTYGTIGTGASLPGALGGSPATVPEGLMNSGSYGVPAPGSGLDVLHSDEMARAKRHAEHKAAEAKGTSGTATAHGDDHGPKVEISAAELRSPLDKAPRTPPSASAAVRRSVVRDHAVAASPLTPGQGGARVARSVPSTSVGPTLPGFSGAAVSSAKPAADPHAAAAAHGESKH